MPVIRYYNVTVESTVRVRAENPEQAATVASSAAKFGQDDLGRAQGNPHQGKAETVSLVEIVGVAVKKEI